MKPIPTPLNTVAQHLHRSYQTAPFAMERENLAMAIAEIERLHQKQIPQEQLALMRNLLNEFSTNCLASSNIQCVSQAQQLVSLLDQVLPRAHD